MALRCLAFFFLTACICSCNSRSDAYTFNRAVISKEELFLPALLRADKKIRSFQKQEKYDSISIIATGVESQIKKAIVEVEKLEVPDITGAEELKQGAIRYFTFHQLAYTIYREYGEAKTDEERNAVYDKLDTEVLRKRESVIAEFRKIQENYASANGFKIRDPVPYRQ